MFKNFFTLAVLIAAFSFGAAALNPAISHAQSTKQLICQGAGEVSGESGCTGSQTKVNKTITTIINILSIFGGIFAVVMMIVGGLRYITSGGAAEKVSSAKNTILYAVIGLIVVALSQVLVKFVLQKTTNP